MGSFFARVVEEERGGWGRLFEAPARREAGAAAGRVVVRAALLGSFRAERRAMNPPRHLRPALSALVLLALPGLAAAAGLLSATGPIDRRIDSLGWCGSSQFPPEVWEYPSVSFVPDGPEVTIQFIATNIDSGMWWTNQSVDNLCITTRITFDTYWQDSTECTSCDPSSHFGFDVRASLGDPLLRRLRRRHGGMGPVGRRVLQRVEHRSEHAERELPLDGRIARPGADDRPRYRAHAPDDRRAHARRRARADLVVAVRRRRARDGGRDRDRGVGRREVDRRDPAVAPPWGSAARARPGATSTATATMIST